MRWLLVLLLLLISLCSGAFAQGTVWGVMEHTPHKNNNSLDSYLTISTNLTTIPCLYNQMYEESGMTSSTFGNNNYIYPKDGYEFMLCYVKIEDYGYNETPARLDGISIGPQKYKGLQISPSFQLLVDDYIYEPKDSIPAGIPINTASLDMENDSVQSSGIEKFNLSEFHGIPGDGYIYLMNGQNASGFIVFYIPKNYNKIGLRVKGLSENGIMVRTPFGKTDIPIDAAHEIIKLNRHPPKQNIQQFTR